MEGLSSLVCVKDFEERANKNLPKDVRDYIGSGALQELTLKENEEAMKRWYIRPRLLVDVSKCNISTTILGHEVRIPFGVAPTGLTKIVHPEGEEANAKAALEMNTVFTLSTSGTTSIETVSKLNDLNFFQLYVFKNRNITSQLVRRAEKNGFKALVVTVDVPFLGIRYTGRRNHFKPPPHLELVNFQSLDVTEEEVGLKGGFMDYLSSLFDDTLNWEDIKWLRSITSLPIVLKGILTGEDAIKGVEAGAAAIWVSNHGGRQLDGVMPTIDVLEEVVDAVAGRCEVYVDGGFRTGSDIFKALAIGANMVFFGRPLVWGLACGGFDGAYKILNILEEELKNVMCLAGCPSIKDISRNFISNRVSSKL